GYRREWTAHFAKEKQQRLAPARISAIVFRIHREWLALPTEAFQEVGEPRGIHSFPHRRNGMVLGLVNIRGALLLCVDLARLLNLQLEPSPQPKIDLLALANGGREQRLLVVSWEGNRLVFPVDEVQGIYRFDTTDLKAPPATIAKSDQAYTQGL